MKALTTNAVYGVRLTSGGWHDQAIQDRTTVRQGWASIIERGGRADSHDNYVMPDGRTLLQFNLDRAFGK